MIRKFVNWVRSFRAASGPTELVFFDGDQATKAELSKFYRANDNTEYHWVQVGPTPPKLSSNMKVQMHRAPNTGKEATDTKITMLLTHLCNKYASTVKRVHVISADGDFADVLETACDLFPTIRFTQMINTRRKTNKDLRATFRRLEGSNCSVVFYRMPTSTKGKNER